MSQYRDDPRWITARWNGKCARTGQPFQRGDQIFYFPRTRSAYAGAAAHEASLEFDSAAADEAFYSNHPSASYHDSHP